jgi:hypothetical protein
MFRFRVEKARLSFARLPATFLSETQISTRGSRCRSTTAGVPGDTMTNRVTAPGSVETDGSSTERECSLAQAGETMHAAVDALDAAIFAADPEVSSEWMIFTEPGSLLSHSSHYPVGSNRHV